MCTRVRQPQVLDLLRGVWGSSGYSQWHHPHGHDDGLDRDPDRRHPPQQLSRGQGEPLHASALDTEQRERAQGGGQGTGVLR